LSDPDHLACSPLETLRWQITTIGDAVRWASGLEVLAPKLGNVHPAARFHDLTVDHFLVAAEHLASSADQEQSVGGIVLRAVRNCQSATGTNVNLGIALLVAPLVLAARRGVSVSQVLTSLDADDAARVYEAIAIARPGGLGRSDAMDVHGPPPPNLINAMRFAADRDSVARQYANNFADLQSIVIPALAESIQRRGDLIFGIRDAQISILSQIPDTLIARKCGKAQAEEIRQCAAEIQSMSPSERSAAEAELDRRLRSDGNRYNPGTTADLIAAGMFVLLAPRAIAF
jgi:triphosphoribosyl-dephospho-CoA synthase